MRALLWALLFLGAGDLSRVQELYQAGDFQAALEVGEQALGELPAGAERTQLLNYLGAISYQLGRFEQAVGHLRQALEGLEDPRSSEAISLRNDLGECLRAAGDFEAARATLDAALEQVRTVAPGSELHAQILNNVAGLSRDEGDFARTESLLREALRITEALPDASGDRIATAQLNLAELLRLQARFVDAEPHYAAALERARATFPPSHPYLVYFLNQYALLHSQSERFAAADSLREEALAVLAAQEVGYPILRAMLLADRAGDLLAHGEAQRALAVTRQLLSLRRESYGPRHWEVGVALAQLARAELDAEAAEPQAIARRAGEALDILGATTVAPESRADAHAVRAAAQQRMHRNDAARDDYAAALEIIEQLRSQRGGGDESRARLLARHAGYYDAAIDLALGEGDLERALDYVERFRARALREQLLLDARRLRASLPPERRDELLQALAQAEAQLVQLQDQRNQLAFDATTPAAERTQALDRLQSELESAVRTYQAAQEQLRQNSPLWQRLLQHRGTSLAALQRELGRGETLLLYWAGPQHAWLLEIDREARAHRLQLGEQARALLPAIASTANSATLAQLIPGTGSGSLLERQRGVAKTVELPEAGAAGTLATPRQRLHALWQTLIPAATWKRLRRAEEVTIVPAGVLHGLPFEALVVAKPEGAQTRYWLDEGPPLRYVDSASTLLQLAQRARAPRQYPPSDVLSVSNPEFGDASASSWGDLPALPGTDAESDRIRAALGAQRVRQLRGVAATESAVRAASAEMRYLHLATHGVVDDRTSEVLAGLVLAREAGEATDGRLQLYEIDAMQLNAQLAVLSACRTAAGKRLESEGVYALSRGFHVAGALRVVASLWSVSDASTAVLIGEFFERLARAEARGERIPYAQALRDAKRVVRDDPRWAQPFYWAPFLLSGAR